MILVQMGAGTGAGAGRVPTASTLSTNLNVAGVLAGPGLTKFRTNRALRSGSGSRPLSTSASARVCSSNVRLDLSSGAEGS